MFTFYKCRTSLQLNVCHATRSAICEIAGNQWEGPGLSEFKEVATSLGFRPSDIRHMVDGGELELDGCLYFIK